MGNATFHAVSQACLSSKASCMLADGVNERLVQYYVIHNYHIHLKCIFLQQTTSLVAAILAHTYLCACHCNNCLKIIACMIYFGRANYLGKLLCESKNI